MLVARPVLHAGNDRNKRERLQISNTVLKLTQKLLKENDSSPNKLSGAEATPA